MVTSGVATIVLGGVMVLLLQTALEQRRGLADATLEQNVATLQAKILQIVRTMSAQEGAVGSEAVSTDGGALLGYRKLIIAQGPTPDYPREALYFDSGTQSVIHDPNISTSGDEETLLAGNSQSCAVRELYFLPSIKVDGTPDPSLINVVFEVDDNGYSGMSRSTNSTSSTILRTFVVKMRNL